MPDPDDFQHLLAALAQQTGGPPPNGSLSATEQAVYVKEAVESGRFGKNVIMNLFKGLMGDGMAAEFSDAFMARLYGDFTPAAPGERLLVENLGVLHAQLMMTRARWAGAKDLADIEALTRIQARLVAELGKVMAAIAEQRNGQRPVIQQAVFGHNQQIINQNVLKTEQDTKHA